MSDKPKGFVDYTGFKSGKVTVLSFDSWNVQPSGQRKSKWLCQCDCGNTFVALGYNIKKEGHTTSCGCEKKKIFSKHRERVASGEWVPEKLVGDRFGRLVVTSFSHWHQQSTELPRISVWNTKCDCGQTHATRIHNLCETSSCGCWKSEKLSEARTIHGMRDSREYRSWCKMKERCTLDSYVEKEYYQDRGINICPEWLQSFESFYNDMGPRPEGTTLDRIDCNLGYCPDNCRWADLTIQAYNRRMGSNNTSGRVGVYGLPNGKWKASISHYNKTIILAHNVSFEEACKARQEGEMSYYGWSKE